MNITAEIRGAVARGWCHVNTQDRTMDAELAIAISNEVESLLLNRVLYVGDKIPQSVVDNERDLNLIILIGNEEWPPYGKEEDGNVIR